MGLWLEGNREEALEVLSEAGRLGSAQAMKDAGDLARELGRDAEARFWFESAANAGHPGALYNMGVYATNAGDLDQAASWWQRSAEAGNPDGYAALTQFADNRGDAAGERRWARLGAEAGHPFCQFRHGLYTLMDNPGDAPAARRAVVYLEAAAELGDLDAMTLVVNVHHQLGQVEQGQAWAARVRATGDQGSIERLDRYGY
jgi:TPR repeat protein